ncbi:MAG: hypothetical protein ABIK28_01355 [Planctomycetota bacterium]
MAPMRHHPLPQQGLDLPHSHSLRVVAQNEGILLVPRVGIYAANLRSGYGLLDNWVMQEESGKIEHLLREVNCIRVNNRKFFFNFAEVVAHAFHQTPLTFFVTHYKLQDPIEGPIIAVKGLLDIFR